MKKLYLFSLLIAAIAIFQSRQAQAKIWRVNNKSNYNGSTLWGDNFGGTSSYPVFAQINQAVGYNLVTNGDTIQVEGSVDVYSPAIITKKLVIIGTGYFLTDNPKTTNNTFESKVNYINLNAGSDGSQVIGLDIVDVGYTRGGINIYVNAVTVKRCKIQWSIGMGGGLSDIHILQNFFSNIDNTDALYFYGAGAPPIDLVFNNNICQRTLNWGRTITQCDNNVFDATNLSFTATEFQNNILIPPSATVNITAAPGAIAFNIGSDAGQFGTDNNNKVVADMSTLFVNVTNKATDSSYQLKSNSPGSNNGSDGTDRGAFGGAAPDHYTLSGLAPIPVIYEVGIPGAANNNLKVTVKARTIK